MKRLIIATLSTLALSMLLAPAAQAETTPNELVNLANTGYLKDQGIPSHDALAHAIRFGQVNAEDLVEAGVADDRLSPEILDDASYLSQVESRLRNLIAD
ncbi:hypothetical protein [Leptolyngbya sp. FACHB-16]|uniref:hypothetical protein n=1 Tax=unclassified Leptolyngbya TaxID=2650499 RepID=UPI0016855879|nr:hypothetical protein [Leptolyngbya sp. FACHB-16]MBD2156557.1 hypothetical protein [Leptolyngbya sp. FACHB-16]